MMQTQWPGLGAGIDFSSPDGQIGNNPLGNGGGPFAAQQPDAIARSWWTCGTAAGNGTGTDPLSGLFNSANGSSGATGSLNGSIGGILSALIGSLQQLLGAFLNQGQAPCLTRDQTLGQSQSSAWNGAQQRFADVDVSSTGDPHLAEVGSRETRSGIQAVDQHWDDMTSHDDLVHSTQIAGGYRVSTAVSQPGASGVTTNQSATVHANFDQDSITMNRDGSFAISDGGDAVSVSNGSTVTLSGGETVAANQDGSLTVTATNERGGSIATTLRGTGGGVDVTTHAHEIALGGDAITHGIHGPHSAHGHKPRHQPVVQQHPAGQMQP